MGDEKHKYMTLKVSSGGESLTPMRYNTMQVAPIEVTVTFEADDPTKLAEAIAKTQRYVDKLYEERFEYELKRHVAHHRQAVYYATKVENDEETARTEAVRKKRSEAG